MAGHTRRLRAFYRRRSFSMQRLFMDGGMPMWFLLAFGIGMLILAVRYAMAPTVWALRATLGLGGATLFTIFAGTCAALGKVGHHAPTFPESTMVEVLLLGFAESMSAGILGFTMLSLGAMILTFGFYRGGKA
jgi:hypothetical protein